MACPRCGDLCTCLPTEDDSAEARISVLIDPEPQSSDITEQSFAASLEQEGWRSESVSESEPHSSKPSNEETNAQDWRDEVASRLQAHRARRRRRFDPDGSLNLQFEPTESAPSSSPRTQAALAVEPVHEEYVPPVTRRRPPPVKVEENNVIEFPPPAAPEATLLEELAEPIVPTPRILDVPETIPEDAPPPLLAGLYLENDPQAEEVYSEISTGIDLPIQAAPMGPRFLCTLLDSLIVALASGGFLAVVLSTSNYQPQGKSALAGLLLLVGFFWSVYHLLFLTFSAGTPGMELAQLQLSDFEGNRPERPLRILRALGMMVSCMSLGMGFAWAMVDEDRLGWHDRITRTYLRQ